MHRKAFKPKTMHTHVTQRLAVSGSGMSSLCAASGDNICVTLVSRQSPASVFILKKEDYVDAKGEKGEELNSICWGQRNLTRCTTNPFGPSERSYLSIHYYKHTSQFMWAHFPAKPSPLILMKISNRLFKVKAPHWEAVWPELMKENQYLTLIAGFSESTGYLSSPF